MSKYTREQKGFKDLNDFVAFISLLLSGFQSTQSHVNCWGYNSEVMTTSLASMWASVTKAHTSQASIQAAKEHGRSLTVINPQ